LTLKNNWPVERVYECYKDREIWFKVFGLKFKGGWRSWRSWRGWRGWGGWRSQRRWRRSLASLI